MNQIKNYLLGEIGVSDCHIYKKNNFDLYIFILHDPNYEPDINMFVLKYKEVL